MKFHINKDRLRRSVRQENRIARDVGGRRVAASGSQPSDKGDVKDPAWLIEAKYTKNVRFSLRLSDWRKIEKQAMRIAKEPAMVIEMAGRSLVVIDYNVWLAVK